MKVKDYKELHVWQKGVYITDQTYLLTRSYPKSEVYGLITQLRRASVSIPSNIAEGFMRKNTKEYLQFLHIALASCAELETQYIISNRQDYLTTVEFNEMQNQINHEIRMLINLIKNLQYN